MVLFDEINRLAALTFSYVEIWDLIDLSDGTIYIYVRNALYQFFSHVVFLNTLL
jgi:hypothetical protein